MPALNIISSFVVWSRHEISRIARLACVNCRGDHNGCVDVPATVYVDGS